MLHFITINYNNIKINIPKIKTVFDFFLTGSHQQWIITKSQMIAVKRFLNQNLKLKMPNNKYLRSYYLEFTK